MRRRHHRPTLARRSLRRAVIERFRPRSHGTRVGLELELFPVDSRSGQAVPLTRVQAALGALAEDVSFEPGGQVELSPACGRSLAELLDRTRSQLDRLEAATAEGGLTLVASGIHPSASFEEVGLQRPTLRYRSMQRHFDGSGSAGRRMMRTTAALQVCVDLLPGAVTEQWNAANAVAPLLAAIADQGSHPGERVRIWRAVDPSRVAWDGRLVGDPVERYLGLATSATPIPVGSGTGPNAVDHHLSTLFPPIRPRGYLEVRTMEAQPWPRTAAGVVLVAALLTDRIAIDGLHDVLGVERDRLEDRWQRVADGGLSDPAVRAEATAVLDIAHASIERIATLDPPENTCELLELLDPAIALDVVGRR